MDDISDHLPLTGVQFSLLSDRDIYASSVTKGTYGNGEGIRNAGTYQNDQPVAGGVMDPVMGISGVGVCTTCGENSDRCPGHPGHIKLAEPLHNMSFNKHLMNALNCVCDGCGSFLLSPSSPQVMNIVANKNNFARTDALVKLCKNVALCPNCGRPKHKFWYEKSVGITALMATPKDTKNTGGQKILPVQYDPQMCYHILSGVSNEIWSLIGFHPEICHPASIIMHNVPVIPVTARPSAPFKLSHSQNHDDITQIYMSLVEHNNNLSDRKDKGGLGGISPTDAGLVRCQDILNVLIMDDAKINKQRPVTGKKAKGITGGVKGKNGLIRGHITGKRTNTNGRGVITGDPSTNVNGLYVPMKIAMAVSYPETVTKKNIHVLQKLVNNGSKVYPGANTVERKEVDIYGNLVRSKYKPDFLAGRKTVLQIGDIVHRHMRDGDWLIFNRQPSLHKLSLMGHQVKVARNPAMRTFRMNGNVVGPYNADFDGDEMNIHLPQSPCAIAEVALIANASLNAISPTNSSIIISAKQDTLAASFTMTSDGIMIDWKQAMDMMAQTDRPLSEYKIPKHTLLPGREVMSYLFPDSLNIKTSSIHVVDGKIVSGSMDSDASKKITGRMWFHPKYHDTMKFLDNLQRICLDFFRYHGYSISIYDSIIDDNVLDECYAVTESIRKEVMMKITAFENDPYTIDYNAFEGEILKILQTVQGKVGNIIINNMTPTNTLRTSVMSGANGTVSNIAQICGVIGQITLSNTGRAPLDYGDRSYPMFHKGDISPEAMGFILRCYAMGIRPCDVFFDSSGALEGVISRAVGTSVTGYSHRRLSRLLEGVHVDYMGHVVTSSGKRLQNAFGGNGVNTERQIWQKLPLLGYDNDQIYKYLVPSSGLSDDVKKKLHQKYVKYRDDIRYTFTKSALSPNQVPDGFYSPVDVSLVLPKGSGQVISPKESLTILNNMINHPDMTILHYQEGDTLRKKDNVSASLVLKAYLYDVLSPRRVVEEYRLSKDQMINVANDIIKICVLSKLDPGCNIGLIAAQGNSEPSTQANMKSFQTAGSGANISGGLDRANEIMQNSKQIATPSMKIYMTEEYRHDQVFVKRIATFLKHTIVEKLCENVHIFHESNLEDPHSMTQKDEATNVFQPPAGLEGVSSDPKELIWGIKLQLSRERMVDNELSMLDIKLAILANWRKKGIINDKYSKNKYKDIIMNVHTICITSNYDNSDKPIIHIRLGVNDCDFEKLILVSDIFRFFTVKGAEGVEDCFVQKEAYQDYDNNTGAVILRDQYCILTNGINYDAITEIWGIDLDNTLVNHLRDVHSMFGIEAARSAYIHEYWTAISSSGAKILFPHVEILADVACQENIYTINRFGAKKLNHNPLSRITFEEPIDLICSSAMYNEIDNLDDIASCTMVGKIIKTGTGACGVSLNLDRLNNVHDVTAKSGTNKSLIRTGTRVADLVKRARGAADSN